MDASTEQKIVFDIQTTNEKIISDYIEARKIETNYNAAHYLRFQTQYHL